MSVLLLYQLFKVIISKKKKKNEMRHPVYIRSIFFKKFQLEMVTTRVGKGRVGSGSKNKVNPRVENGYIFVEVASVQYWLITFIRNCQKFIG